MTTKPGSYRIAETFLHLGADGTAIPLPFSETFWEDLDGGKFGDLGGGRLVTYFQFTEDWGVWEMHPAGEEIVVLLSGAVDFVLKQPGGETTIALGTPGSYVIVPRGTWHTANVREAGAMLFLTPGDGTEHAPR